MSTRPAYDVLRSAIAGGSSFLDGAGVSRRQAGNSAQTPSPDPLV